MQYFRIWYLIANIIFIGPWSFVQTLGGRFEWFYDQVEPMIREMYPPGLNNWMLYINDPERNKNLDFFQIDQTQYDDNDDA